MDEDGKIYRGVFGTLPGQMALTRLMEEGGFFAPVTGPEAVSARNYVMNILGKMEVFKYPEDRREFVAQMLRRTSERYVEQTKQEVRRKK